MSNAIFRVQGIKTTNDLRGIGKHNVERKSSKNDDIDPERTKFNINLIQSQSYLKEFFKTVEPMKQEHDEKMKTERKDRVRSFEGKINSGKNDVACEFLFTSDEKFFEGKSRDQIQSWAQQSLNFVKDEIGIDEKNILHAVVHMDEKTPHLHVVAVPLVNKYDGRAKKDVWQINRKHFIKTKEDMSILQDKYFEHMKNAGHDLERGEKGSQREHLNTEEFKAKKLEEQIAALQEVEQGLLKAVEGSKSVVDIKVERVGLFGPKSVKLSEEDFVAIETLAKSSEGLKRANNHLKMENENLKIKNVALKDLNWRMGEENGKLKTENKQLKELVKSYKEIVEKFQSYKKLIEKTFEMMKISSKKHLDVPLEKMQSYIGESRMYVMFKMFGKESFTKENLENHFTEDERAGAEKLMQRINKIEQEKEPQIEVEKTIETRFTKDFEMDR